MTTPTNATHKHASSMPYLSPFEQNRTYAESFSNEYDQMRKTDFAAWETKKNSVVQIYAESIAIIFTFFYEPGKVDVKSQIKIPYNQDTDKFTGLCYIAMQTLYGLQKNSTRIEKTPINDQKV